MEKKEVSGEMLSGELMATSLPCELHFRYQSRANERYAPEKFISSTAPYVLGYETQPLFIFLQNRPTLFSLLRSFVFYPFFLFFSFDAVHFSRLAR